MTESIYKEFENKYYNPDDNDKRPGDNDNWKSIQEGFSKISTTQLETSKGLTLGKGTEDETSVTAAEMKEMKSGWGTISHAYTGYVSNCTFVSGWNNHVVQNTTALFPPERLKNFTPGKYYKIIGVWSTTTSDPTWTDGAVGITVPFDIAANSDGQLDIGSTIPYMGISTGTFTRTVGMTLLVAENG